MLCPPSDRDAVSRQGQQFLSEHHAAGADLGAAEPHALADKQRPLLLHLRLPIALHNACAELGWPQSTLPAAAHIALVVMH